MEKILVINGGSSSFKYQVLEKGTERRLCQGLVERIGAADSLLTHKRFDENGNEEKFVYPGNYHNHAAGMDKVAEVLMNAELGGVIADRSEIVVIGHRVLLGGPLGNSIVTEEVKQIIRDYIPLGPLHNPANLTGIEAMEKIFPGVPNVAVFDTGFHSTMPDYAYTYALPKALTEKYGLRRYGFHGSSHSFVSKAAAALLGKKPSEVNVIVCHLGNGSSISCVRGGKCVDTSMGTTPLQGVVMGTRCGDIDPAAVVHLMKLGMKAEEIDTLMNKQSGLYGVAGINSGDMRDVLGAAAEGNEQAELAVKMFVRRIVKYIGAYYVLVGGPKALVFTGGIGEFSVEIRSRILKSLAALGIAVNEDKNKECFGKCGVISTDDSKWQAIVMPTDEELMIARSTKALVK